MQGRALITGVVAALCAAAPAHAGTATSVRPSDLYVVASYTGAADERNELSIQAIETTGDSYVGVIFTDKTAPVTAGEGCVPLGLSAAFCMTVHRQGHDPDTEVYVSLGDGNDTLEPGKTGLRIVANGDAGDDHLAGDDSQVHLNGNDGDDTIEPGPGGGWASGGPGNDVIRGSENSEEIRGGPGDDRLSGNGLNDLLMPGSGSDRVEGGWGQDTLDYTDIDDGVSISLDGLANDGVDGSASNLKPDLEGIRGSRGSDTITGGAGTPFIEGWEGDDTIEAGAATSSIRGGDGSNTLVGSPQTQLLVGGDGADHIVAKAPGAWVNGADGDDVLESHNRASLFDGGGNDRVIGSGGDDSIIAGGGTDSFDGGGGRDQISYWSHGVSVTLDGVANDGPPGENDQIIHIEDVEGTSGDDYIEGDAGSNVIDGSYGADLVVGGAGDDFIDGGFHADRIEGGPGDDDLLGNEGNDSLYGDGGNDVLRGADADPSHTNPRTDELHCGDGFDLALPTVEDFVAPDCEDVR